MTPIATECDPILKIQNIKKIVTLEFTTKSSNIIPIKISEGSAQIDTPLPMHLINIMSKDKTEHLFLRNHKGTYYSTPACDLNIPRPGELGDMQIDLQIKKSTYPDWAVQCKIKGSTALCSTAEPGYYRSLRLIARNKVEIYKSNMFSVTTRSLVRGSVSFMFRTVDKPGQMVEPASCSV